eukprot:UN07569
MVSHNLVEFLIGVFYDYPKTRSRISSNEDAITAINLLTRMDVIYAAWNAGGYKLPGGKYQEGMDIYSKPEEIFFTMIFHIPDTVEGLNENTNDR